MKRSSMEFATEPDTRARSGTEYVFEASKDQEAQPAQFALTHTQPQKKYSLIHAEPSITPQQAEVIARDLHSNFTLPLGFLRKNSDALKNLPFDTSFSRSALNFIALARQCSDPGDDERQNLADLVLIVKHLIALQDKTSRDFLVAALTFTLKIDQLIAVFLEFAPSAEEFNPKVGFCRGDNFYSTFFPHFAETFGNDYLNAVIPKIKTLVKIKHFSERDMDEIEQELKQKKYIPPEKLSKESNDFLIQLIKPTIEILEKNCTQLMMEFSNFFLHSLQYMHAWKKKEVDPLQQLFGLFFLKFLMPELLSKSDLSDLQYRAIKTIANYLQHLSTLWLEDPHSRQLFHMMANIAKPRLNRVNLAYFPFTQEFAGDRPPLVFYVRGEHFEWARNRLQGENPSETADENSVAVLISARSHSVEPASIEPEKHMKTKCQRACRPSRAIITGTLATLIPAAAVLGNVEIDQWIATNIGTEIAPWWVALGWESSLVAATPPAAILLIWLVYLFFRVNQEHRTFANFHQHTEVDKVFLDRRNKYSMGDTTEEEKLLTDDAEEGTPRPT